MNIVTVDIKAKLIATGDVQATATKAWFISLHSLPPTPRKCVALVAPGTGRTQYVMDTARDPWEEGGFQIFVRGEGYNSTWQKIDAIVKVLARLGRFVEGGASYSGVTQNGEIGEFSSDEKNGLYTFVTNMTAHRQGTAGV